MTDLDDPRMSRTELTEHEVAWRERVLAGGHFTREVVDGVYIWRDDLPCDPECEPEKGIHVVRGALGGRDSGLVEVVPQSQVKRLPAWSRAVNAHGDDEDDE